MRGKALVVGASRSLVTTSERDARTTNKILDAKEFRHEKCGFGE
jgi:hypothetical protein